MYRTTVNERKLARLVFCAVLLAAGYIRARHWERRWAPEGALERRS